MKDYTQFTAYFSYLLAKSGFTSHTINMSNVEYGGMITCTAHHKTGESITTKFSHAIFNKGYKHPVMARMLWLQLDYEWRKKKNGKSKS